MSFILCAKIPFPPKLPMDVLFHYQSTIPVKCIYTPIEHIMKFQWMLKAPKLLSQLKAISDSLENNTLVCGSTGRLWVMEGVGWSSHV